MRQNHAHAPVVSITATGRTTATPAASIKSKPRDVSICTCVPWAPRLQQTSVRAHRDGSAHSCQTAQTADICTTLRQGIQHWHIIRALPMPTNMDEGHACNQNFGGSVVQAQVLDEPYGHTRRSHRSSNWRTSKDSDLQSTTAITRYNAR